MGVPCFEVAVPRSILKRISKLTSENDPIIRELAIHERTLELKRKSLAILGTNDEDYIKSTKFLEKPRDELYSKIDGKPLVEFIQNPSGQLWMTGRSSIVSGKNFRQMVKLRIGRLPTLENCNRGRDVDKKCRKCGRVNETLQHITQGCHYTHFTRMSRHDSIVMLIQNKSIELGYEVLCEPVFEISDRKLKPDLVIVTNEVINVIDVSIVSENMKFRHSEEPATLEGAWNFKRAYYEKEVLSTKLKNTFGKESVWYGAIIISTRGIWCAKNDETLKQLKIPTSTKELLVVRCMERTIKIWNHFMKET